MYGIHRVEKRKKQAVGGLQNEANRDAKNPKNFAGSDIDWADTELNDFLIKSDNWTEDINAKIKHHGIENYRSDAVVMLDSIYTASPEFFSGRHLDDIEDYFKQCLDFHTREYCHGDKSLLVNAVIHYDETTPHLHICSVPITADGRLSAKDVMGNKKQYNQRQDKFYEQVTKGWGLSRGQKNDNGQKREHINQMDYKSQQADERLAEQSGKIKRNREVINQQIGNYNGRKDALNKLNQQIMDAQYKVKELDDAIQERENALKTLENDLNNKSIELDNEIASVRQIRAKNSQINAKWHTLFNDTVEVNKKFKGDLQKQRENQALIERVRLQGLELMNDEEDADAEWQKYSQF